MKSFGYFLFISMKEEGAPSLVTATHVDFFSSVENKISLVVEGMVLKGRWLITAQ